MTGCPRSSLKRSTWSGVAFSAKSGAGVPAGRIVGGRSDSVTFDSCRIFLLLIGLFPRRALKASKTAAGVVVDDADGLRPGVDDRRADEFETTTLHLPRDLLG